MNQPEAGLTVPPFYGEGRFVRYHCNPKLAVKLVVEFVTVMMCASAPPSFQFVNVRWQPDPHE